VGTIELRRQAGLPYRDARPDGEELGAPVVLVHGFPESSLMWESVMAELARAGRRAVAPDLFGLGDSGDDAPTTFERNLEAFGRFIDALELDRVALVVHDWGGFVGLAWACDHPDRVDALVISDTGFFADGKWHEMGKAMRSEQGEELVAALDRGGFAGLLESAAPGAFDDAKIDAYWKPFEDGPGRRATLDFYRSMDFEKLEPWQGKLRELGVPTLILWGADDRFAPLKAAQRFEREIPGSRLVVIEGAGHFVYDEQPERSARALAGFLSSS
jgi:haloalkane dehalogenase